VSISARERILDVATELFCSQGIRAIGVDTIIAKSNIAKTTLYHHFQSKDELVVAFLKGIDNRYWKWWDKAINRHPNNAREQILELFRALARKVSSPKYRGCPFINTLTEFPDPRHPSRLVIAANKKEVYKRLKALAQRLDAVDSDALAKQLIFLMDGVYSLSMMVGFKNQTDALVGAAEVLVSAQLRE